MSFRVILFVSLVTPLFAQGTDERLLELEYIKQQVQILQNQLEKAQAKKRSLQNELVSIKLKQQLLEQELRSLEIEAALRTEELNKLSESLKEDQVNLVHLKQQLLSKVKFLQHLGGLSYFKLLLLAKGEDFLQVLRWLIHLAQEDQAMIAQYQEKMEDLEEKKTLLKKTQQAIEDLLKERNEKAQDLEKTLRQKTYLVKQLERKTRETREKLANFQERADRLERLVKLLAQSVTPREVKKDPHAFKGILDWPANGKVAVPFGTIQKEGVEVDSQGIEIELSEPKLIQPIFPGKVLFARWFKGFKNLVMVDHGFGVLSIYGYLTHLMVKPGDWVSPGKPLGKVENPGAPHRLYLEIRDRGDVVDPLSWLR